MTKTLNLSVLISAFLFSPVLHAACGEEYLLPKKAVAANSGYDARLFQYAQQNQIPLLNLKISPELSKFSDLQNQLQILINHMRSKEGKSPLLVGILDSEQVKVQIGADAAGKQQFVFVSMGLLRFVADDNELANVISFELKNPNLDKSIPDKYKNILYGPIDIKPVLERTYDPAYKDATSATTVVTLVKDIKKSPAYIQYLNSKFDGLMNVDLSATRAVIDPLYKGGSLPSPNSLYFQHYLFETYYAKFKTLFPIETTPAEILRHLEIRLQVLIRTQMIRFVEEIVQARSKIDNPLNKDEILILHHMLYKDWMLHTEESTSMVRMGHSPWLVSWAFEMGRLSLELAELSQQLNAISNDKHRLTIQTQILELRQRRKSLEVKFENISQFYQLDMEAFGRLKAIHDQPDKAAAHAQIWEPLFQQSIKELGPVLVRAAKLRDRINSEFGHGGMLRDLRAKPEEAFWLLRAADKMSIQEQIDLNKKAQDILIELKAYKSLRTLVRSDHDSFTVHWYKENQAEAQAYMIRALKEIAKDKEFDANEPDLHRGPFAKEFIGSYAYLERYLASHDRSKSYDGYILTPELRFALGELAWAGTQRKLLQKTEEQKQILANTTLSDKDRNSKLFSLFAYQNHLNAFYISVLEHLDIQHKLPANQLKTLVQTAEDLAITVYTEMFKMAGVANPQETALVFLSLNSRHFGEHTGRKVLDVKMIARFAEAIQHLPFMTDRFIKIGSLINRYKSASKSQMISIVELLQDYIETGYLEALPDGMSAARYFDMKNQIALHFAKAAQPNFILVGHILADKAAGQDVRAHDTHKAISSLHIRSMIFLQFDYYWKKHAHLDKRARIQQALKDFFADGDRLVSVTDEKLTFAELASQFAPAGEDRTYFIQQVIDMLIANPNYIRIGHDALIQSLQMMMKLNL